MCKMKAICVFYSAFLCTRLKPYTNMLCYVADIIVRMLSCTWYAMVPRVQVMVWVFRLSSPNHLDRPKSATLQM